MTDDPTDPETEHEVPDGTTLTITVEDPDEFHDRVAAKLSELDEEVVPQDHVRAYSTATQVRRVLTDRRLELIETIMAEPAESITALAERVGRATSDVHDDLNVLADEGIVHFERDGRRVRPTIPYDEIHIDITLPRKRGERADVEAHV